MTTHLVPDQHTFQIIGAAMEVHGILHRGLFESIYCEAIAVEFAEPPPELGPGVVEGVARAIGVGPVRPGPGARPVARGDGRLASRRVGPARRAEDRDAAEGEPF